MKSLQYSNESIINNRGENIILKHSKNCFDLDSLRNNHNNSVSNENIYHVKIIKSKWTAEEDYLLFKKYTEKPKDWEFISKFIIHRTEKQIKSHFNSLILSNIKYENSIDADFNTSFYNVFKNKTEKIEDFLKKFEVDFKNEDINSDELKEILKYLKGFGIKTIHNIYNNDSIASKKTSNNSLSIQENVSISNNGKYLKLSNKNNLQKEIKENCSFEFDCSSIHTSTNQTQEENEKTNLDSNSNFLSNKSELESNLVALNYSKCMNSHSQNKKNLNSKDFLRKKKQDGHDLHGKEEENNNFQKQNLIKLETSKEKSIVKNDLNFLDNLQQKLFNLKMQLDKKTPFLDIKIE